MFCLKVLFLFFVCFYKWTDSTFLSYEYSLTLLLHCPYLCFVSFPIVFCLFEWKWTFVYVLLSILFISVLYRWRSKYQDGMAIGVPLNVLNPSRLCSRPGPVDFHRHILWFVLCFMVWGRRWLFIILFYFGDHHCLNFLL